MAKLSRQLILDAARNAVDQLGHESLSLRAVARQLEVTAPALYDHFDSKDDLLRAVAEQGFDELVLALDPRGDRAIDRIRHRALLYVAFAAQNPELFRLMFLFRPSSISIETDDGPAPDNELAAAGDAFDDGKLEIIGAIADGDLRERDIDEIAMITWIITHGVATMALTAPALAEAVAQDVVDTMLAGLRPS